MKKLIILFIDRVSQYSIASFYFWVYMIRGGVIYGFVPAAIGLIKSVESIQSDDDQFIRTVFHRSYQQNRQYKGLSFLLFLFAGLSLMSVYPRLYNQYPFLALLQMPLLIWTAVILVFTIYSAYFLAMDKKSGHEAKWIYALAFDTSIRHPLRSVLVFVMIVAISLLAKLNFVAFIFLSPPLFIIATKRLIYIPQVLYK